MYKDSFTHTWKDSEIWVLNKCIKNKSGQNCAEKKKQYRK